MRRTSLPSLRRGCAAVPVVALAATWLACASTEGESRDATRAPAGAREPGSDAPGSPGEPESSDEPAPSTTDAGAAPVCRRTVCLTGAVDHASGSNAGFRALCESSLVSGRIDDCRGGTCKSTFGTFPSNVATPVWDAVFAALDTDRNGKLDASDAPCELDVLGFSWGGVNAVGLARLMHEDPRVSPPWRLTRLVLLDAYQPLAELKVPPNVARTWSFRHSIAPGTDCSKNATLGPYLGLPPRCPSTQPCFDHDFSKSPGELFGGIKGSAVGHCDVPAAARPNVAQLLRDEPLTGAPAAVPVAP